MLDEEDWGLEVNPPFKSFAGDTSVYCKKCHKRFYHPQNFLHHLRDKHGEIQLYCNVCYEYKNKKIFFLSENLYEEHAAKWHTSSSYKIVLK